MESSQVHETQKGHAKRWTASMLAAVLLLTPVMGCADVVRAVVIAAGTAGVVAIAVKHVHNARSASFDADLKELEIEAVKANGQTTRTNVMLSAGDAKKVQETKKIKIKLDNGTETEIPVTIK